MKIFKNLYWYFGILFVFIYSLPWIYYGELSYIRIHDGLDSLMAWYKILGGSDFLFVKNSLQVGPIFQNGLPRLSYPNELSIVTILFSIFDPYWAYVFNQILIRLIAFSGMYLLLITIFNRIDILQKLALFSVAVLYSFLPFWGWSGSIAALPFILYVIYRVWSGKLGALEVIILILYPLYSSLFLAGLYVVLIFWTLFLASYIFKHHKRVVTISALIVTLTHILIEYRYIDYFFRSNFVSHRVDFLVPKNTFYNSLLASIDVFKFGDWAVTNHNPIILYSCLTIISYIVIVKILSYVIKLIMNGYFNKITPISYSYLDNLFLYVILCVLVSIFCGFYYWNGLAALRAKIEFLNTINLTRVSFFLPSLWFLIFACTLLIISNNFKHLKWIIIPSLIIAQATIELKNHEFFVSKDKYGITYKEFYSESLFEEIAKHLPADKKSYVTASLGLHPSIAQFNGFRTADAYLVNYPKDYKVKFRRAVINEFSKNSQILSYFDDWGNRVYFFSSYAKMRCPRDDSLCKKAGEHQIPFPAFDTNAMKELGIEYLFSVNTFSDAPDRGLQFIGTFTNSDSPWSISIYKLL